MSIQPSLSWSKKAQPAPVDSGRYFSGELPAVWTKLMPLLEAGISVNGNCGVSRAYANRESQAEAAVALRNRRKSRRPGFRSGVRRRVGFQPMRAVIAELPWIVYRARGPSAAPGLRPLCVSLAQGFRLSGAARRP